MARVPLTSASCGGEADGEAHKRVDREHVGMPEQRQTGNREHCVEQVGSITHVGTEAALVGQLPRQHKRRQSAWSWE